MNGPQPGNMYLYDRIVPPLVAGSYRLTAGDDVRHQGNPLPLDDQQRYLELEGPRFALAATEVAGVFPPRNATGSFQHSLPHIVLGRRTLPWERQLDPHGLIGPSTGVDGDPPALESDRAPWLALVLFEEHEYVLRPNTLLTDVVPADVHAGLGAPAGLRCDAVEADLGLLQDILPSKDEVQLLTHVRQVSVEDRELAAGDSDGWFAVVVANRLPRPGVRHRACLVSLEARTDLIRADPPPSYVPPANPFELTPVRILLGPRRLVLLHSWPFTCEGQGTFEELMNALDSGMIGKVRAAGRPPVADTGHLPLSMQDRAGAPETVWYRGPLVPHKPDRDPLGPYHSGDQARRVAPETGAEDVSYAAAFEVGRLLASADTRLAQELMRWRRGAYRQSARADTIASLPLQLLPELPPDAAERLQAILIPLLETGVLTRIRGGCGPLADPQGLLVAGRAPGCDPQALLDAWQLTSLDDARALLGEDAGALGNDVPAPPTTPRGPATLGDLVADQPALDALRVARDRLVDNALERGGPI